MNNYEKNERIFSDRAKLNNRIDKMKERMNILNEENKNIKKNLINWNDINEKVPETSGEYLVTIENKNCTLDRFIRFAVYIKEDNKWVIPKFERVIAWMNKPRPYLRKIENSNIDIDDLKPTIKNRKNNPLNKYNSTIQSKEVDNIKKELKTKNYKEDNIRTFGNKNDDSELEFITSLFNMAKDHLNDLVELKDITFPKNDSNVLLDGLKENEESFEEWFNQNLKSLFETDLNPLGSSPEDLNPKFFKGIGVSNSYGKKGIINQFVLVRDFKDSPYEIEILVHVSPDKREFWTFISRQNKINKNIKFFDSIFEIEIPPEVIDILIKIKDLNNKEEI